MEDQKEKLGQQVHIPLILRDLWRNAWLIVLAGIIALMSVFCYAGLLHTPEYTTTVVFAVSPRSNGSYVGFYNSLRTAGEMAEVFKEVFASDVLKRLVKEDLGNPNLAIRVSAELEEETNILRVSAQANDPLAAYTIMESVLRNYGRVSEYLFGNVVLDTVKSPHIPTEPSNAINMPLVLAIALIVGMLGMGCGIATLSAARATVKTFAGAKYCMGEAPMGVLIQEKGTATGRKRKIKGLLIWKTTVSFRYTEAVLQVAHKLFHRMQKEHKKVLLITSVAENEGKSTLAANLAIALAKHGHRVALVDMDLRKPSLHKLFSEIDICVDMERALEQEIPADESRKMLVLTAENMKQNPGSLLHDPRLERLLQHLREEMDIVILDSAPYGAVADTGMLLKYADGCLMSVRQDWAPHKVLRDMSRELDEGSADYMGYVLNYYLDDGSMRKQDKKYKEYQ